MPRNSALIEAFPPAYIYYSFRTLSDACNVQFFELYGKISSSIQDKYEKYCGTEKLGLNFGQCSNQKSENGLVDVDETVCTVLLALPKTGQKSTSSKYFTQYKSNS